MINNRPMGLMQVWDYTVPGQPKLLKHALFGYYQNGVDYLQQYAQAKGWSSVSAYNGIAFQTGNYHIELSLVEAKGMDLSQETYLETPNAEAQVPTTEAS